MQFIGRMLVILLGLISTGAPAFASTQILFSRDGTKATVLMLALTQNEDAVALFKAIQDPPQDMQGKITKQVALNNAAGVKAVQVLCAFSKIAPGTGSCSITLNHVDGVTLDASRNLAQLTLEGSLADAVAAHFVAPDATGEIYKSSDNHVRIEHVGPRLTLGYE